LSRRDNLDALGRLQSEPGWAGVLVRERAPGALAIGAPVVKVRSEPGDTFPDGTRGTVLGSIGPGPDEPIPTPHGATIPAGAYLYFVEWEPRPRCAVAIASNRLAHAAEMIRALLLVNPRLRVQAADLVEAMLTELADLDDHDPMPEWTAGLDPEVLEHLPSEDVAGLRIALRHSLEQFAEYDAP
jgi:hypothetical protein